jgi:hypothetical protein
VFILATVFTRPWIVDRLTGDVAAQNIARNAPDALYMDEYVDPHFRFSTTGDLARGLAIGTETEDSKTMTRWLKVELSCDFILLVFDNFAVKLDQLTALGADQMVVMLMIVIMLVSFAAVAQPLFARQPAFVQQFERSIDGGKADARVFGLDKVVQIFSAQMSFGFEKNFKDQLALRCFLKTRAPQVIEEYLFLFRHLAHKKPLASNTALIFVKTTF